MLVSMFSLFSCVYEKHEWLPLVANIWHLVNLWIHDKTISCTLRSIFNVSYIACDITIFLSCCFCITMNLSNPFTCFICMASFANISQRYKKGNHCIILKVQRVTSNLSSTVNRSLNKSNTPLQPAYVMDILRKCLKCTRLSVNLPWLRLSQRGNRSGI
jgi:hypothetical protein